ncbi:MAG: hypothetical protein ACR2KP_11435 [Egibacteraceae bacterium]
MFGTRTADTTENFCRLCDRGVVVDSEGRCVLGHRVAPARPGAASHRAAHRPAGPSTGPQVGARPHGTPSRELAPIIGAPAAAHQGPGRMTHRLRLTEPRPTLMSLFGLDGPTGSALDVDAAALPVPIPITVTARPVMRVLTPMDDEFEDARFARRHALFVGGTALGVAAAVGTLVSLAL